MTRDLNTKIMTAVDSKFDEQTAFLSELSSFPSTRGNEQSAQDFMAENLKERGYQTDIWSIDVNDIAHLPGFSPPLVIMKTPRMLLPAIAATAKKANP